MAAFDFVFSFNAILFSITEQVLVCVVKDESLIIYNDNKHYLFGTYYLTRLCGVYLIYTISF